MLVAILSLDGSRSVFDTQNTSLNLIVAIHVRVPLVSHTRVLLRHGLSLAANVALVARNRHSLVLGRAVLPGFALSLEQRVLPLLSLLGQSVMVVLVAQVGVEVLANKGIRLSFGHFHLLGATGQLLLPGGGQLLGSVVL